MVISTPNIRNCISLIKFNSLIKLWKLDVGLADFAKITLLESVLFDFTFLKIRANEYEFLVLLQLTSSRR